MKRVERAWIVVLCVTIGWFYLWTARSTGDPWNFGNEQRDYYNLLIDGYLDGQLHMKVEVPAALLRLKNPYDPAERPLGLGLHDASFYRGRYYIYFGAAPMVLLMLPFRLVTGIDLPLAAAVWVFVCGGFMASVALWLAVRRRYFPETGLLAVTLGILVLGLAGVGPVLLRRPQMWELPLAGGYCFAMLALGCVWLSLHSAKGRVRWFAAAGLLLGFAIASRPTYLFATPLLAFPLIGWWRSERLPPWRAAIAGAAPLALVGALMAWHNYARFGNPLEFGQTYQLSLDYESRLPHFRGAYVPYNVHEYFFSVPEWKRYFPFFQRTDWGRPPEGYTSHRGDVYGLLVAFPILWLAWLAPLAVIRRPKEERGPLRVWLATTATLFALPVAMLLWFFSALARYQMDFAPAFSLLACVGLLVVERWVGAAGNRWSVVVRLGVAIAAVASALFGVLFSLQYDGLLQNRNPRLEREVARTLNQVPGTIERLAGVTFGVVDVKFQLTNPAGPPRRETLLTSGESPDLDRVFLVSRDDGRLQFGVAPQAGPERVSRPLAVQRESPHVVRISLGSFYPPETHPFFSRRTEAEIGSLTRSGRIDLDGETILDVPLHFSSTAKSPKTGDAAEPAAGFEPFSGRILSVARTDPTVSSAALMPADFIRLRLSFPRTLSEPEPLLSLGSTANGVVVCVRDAGDGRIVPGWRTTKGESGEADPVSLDRAVAHEAVVQIFRVGNERRRVRLALDGVIAFSREFECADVLPVPGRNTTGVSTCAAEFRGVIHSSDRGLDGRDPLRSETGAIELRVKLPANRRGEREPLVVTGWPGNADQLLVEYADDRTVRFAFDHWGDPLLWSDPVPVDYARPHELEVRMSSLFDKAPGLPERPIRAGFVRVSLDGQVAWQREGFFFAVRRDEIAVGENPVGGTACGPRFTGSILAAKRAAK